MTKDELRCINRKTVEIFLTCNGPDRNITRGRLFAEDGVQEIGAPIGGEFVLRSTPYRQWLDTTVQSVPEWGLYDNVIFETEDPNVFLVRSHGLGKCYENGQLVPMDHHYINEFRLRDGKITLFREIPDPCEEKNPYRP